MDKVILITGASRGIGAATALLAAEKKFQVCINYLKRDTDAAEVAAEINAAGGKAVTFKADVSKEAEVEKLFQFIDGELGRLDGLVNNTGIVEKQSRVAEMTYERLHHMFNTNVISYFLCCREAIKRMSTRYGGRGGAIVNVSSAASRIGSPNEYVDYASTKGAIDTFTLGLSKELAGESIRVNAVRPGLIYTDIHGSGGDPNRIERLKDSIPMKRGGYPEEVARAILWLLADDASYVTGALLDVTGGR